MKKRILTSAIACVAAMSLSVAAFAASEPGATNGSSNAAATVADDGAVTITNDQGLVLDAPEGAFEAGAEVVLDATVSNIEEVADAATTTETVAAAAAKVLGSEEEVKVDLNTKLDLTLTVDGEEVQPGVAVTVTVAYDGASNVVVYVGENTVEFIKLTVNEDGTASFTTTHFSDYYLATVSDDVLADLEGQSADVDNSNDAAGDTDVATNDKNQNTGVVFAIVPVAVAAAAVVVSKKRK